MHYTFWNPDNFQIEALWKIWRAWIISNCPVHDSELIYFTNWRTLSILKHFNNFKLKHVYLDLILYLNFDLQLLHTGQLKNKDNLHSETFLVTHFDSEGRFQLCFSFLFVIESTWQKYYRLKRYVCSTNNLTLTTFATLEFENVTTTMCLAQKN